MACAPLPADGLMSIATTLGSIDCQSNVAVQSAFSRLFGETGTLGQALTLILTLYVGFLALNMLTGRSRISVSMITPRMWQLGLVLTFATSWVAYQSVVWTLLVRAPDELASILLNTQGSATSIFAARLDGLFGVLAQSAQISQGANAVAPAPGTIMPQMGGASAKPADLLWLASLLLMLGTVGVLIVTRVALAALIAIGPIFVVLSLFEATRGLFEGWLKTAVALAITPIFAVLLGSATLSAIAPLILSLMQSGGKVPLGLATSIFLAAFVYLALMFMATRAARMLTSGWQLSRASQNEAAPLAYMQGTAALAHGGGLAFGARASSNGDASTDPRVRDVIAASAAVYPPLADQALSGTASGMDLDGEGSRRQLESIATSRDPRLRPLSWAARAEGKGSQ